MKEKSCWVLTQVIQQGDAENCEFLEKGAEISLPKRFQLKFSACVTTTESRHQQRPEMQQLAAKCVSLSLFQINCTQFTPHEDTYHWAQRIVRQISEFNVPHLKLVEINVFRIVFI